MNIVKSTRRILFGSIIAGALFALPQAAFAAPITVVIDPGHGGHDSGAVGNGVKEKSTNLAISKEIAKDARRQGWKVKMTRNSDKFLPLKARAAVANRTPNSVLVSMHSNSTGRKALGNMTIYRNGQSKKLGRSIMRYLAPQTDYKDIGNKGDVRGLAVLRNSKRPAVIVENLSVSAKKEAQRLKQPEERKAMARAVVKGIADYKGVKYKVSADELKQREKAKQAAAEKAAQAKAKKANASSSPETATATEQHLANARSVEVSADNTPISVSLPAARNALAGALTSNVVPTESALREQFRLID